jgi:hypothetical protein
MLLLPVTLRLTVTLAFFAPTKPSPPTVAAATPPITLAVIATEAIAPLVFAPVEPPTGRLIGPVVAPETARVAAPGVGGMAASARPAHRTDQEGPGPEETGHCSPKIVCVH